MSIVAFDIGIHSVKAAVLNTETGQAVGPIAQAAMVLDSPCPEAFEVPAERLWRALAAVSRAAVQQAGVSGKAGQDIAGLGLSCFLSGLVLLDKADRPLQPIWMPHDRRSRSAARQVWNAVGEDFLHTTGSRPLPGATSVLCLRQMLTADPYLLHDVRSYLHAGGWLAFHMTGRKAFDAANASCSGLFGTLTDRQWSDRWCEYSEVEKDWLPPVLSASATVGTLRAEVAADLGVPAGVPVKLGADEICSAALAAGMEVGDLVHLAGKTQLMAVLTDKPAAAPPRVTRLLGFGDAFVQVAHNPVGANALEWLRALCFHDQTEKEFYEATIPAALDRQTRVTLDPPFLAGAPLEIEACRASFRDLELTTDRLDLLAALLQAMIRRHREALAALGKGGALRRIFLSGDGSGVLRRLLPGYQDADIHTLDESSLRGVARLFRL